MQMGRKFKVLIMLAIIFFLTGFIQNTEEPNRSNNTADDTKAYEVDGPLTITVILERVFLDGEVSEEIVEETIWSMEDFWSQYEDWHLVHRDEEQVVFQQHVDDISPLLKSNGYFGISEEGVLTIFDGRPHQSNKVIQSFFQLDVNKLESRQHDLLKQGIKIGSKDEYINVIETFKTYTSSH
jgi:forespore regulator of the sigma-K checkpoint